ncbi:MAG: HAD family hydrolase [Pseudomonadota bacterium]|nr:HAD family hydrolase [Pseudomonadota bacterium]MEC9372142.1 HAD family hydrolase [Pseudomonadota bacterium]MED5391536.1 HAD family hydrolase [Pseudomonadota bacterium]MEE3293854.1 HAD family hydrolase [Pseudomonadota bacterium]
MGRAVFTDLDGTLLGSDQQLSPANHDVLEVLGQQGILRVVVTGRSLFSCRRVLDRSFPIDLLVTSSGAGIFSFPNFKLLFDQALTETEVSKSIEVLNALKLDFMVHDPVPDNHRFRWHQHTAHNPDFAHRLTVYEGHHRPIEEPTEFHIASTQLVAVSLPGDNGSALPYLKQKLSELTVIRTTSPLDHQSTWYEIFPNNVSKSSAAAWVCSAFNVDSNEVFAIGNDYNDLDLLRWCSRSRVVANAPAELTSEFEIVASHDDDGFAQAIVEWLDSL